MAGSYETVYHKELFFVMKTSNDAGNVKNRRKRGDN